MYLGIFQEKKLTNGVYTHGSARYRIVSTYTPSRHCGGVAVFYRPSPCYALEAVQQFSTNVFGFWLATGE